MGGIFALNPYDKDKYPGENNNLYGKSAGINDIRLGATYKLKVGKFDMPVSAQMMWNPEASKAYFRASITLINIQTYKETQIGKAPASITSWGFFVPSWLMANGKICLRAVAIFHKIESTQHQNDQHKHKKKRRKI